MRGYIFDNLASHKIWSTGFKEHELLKKLAKRVAIVSDSSQKLQTEKESMEKESIKYEQAVEEALCFGWIDSIVRRIDDEKHMQKYTPRKVNSN